MRILPPLTITYKEIEEGIRRLKRAFIKNEKMIVNNFLNLNEITPKNLKAILDDASKLKKAGNFGYSVSERDPYSNCLNNTITGLLFEKLSTRTRLSFEAAVLKLGGQDFESSQR